MRLCLCRFDGLRQLSFLAHNTIIIVHTRFYIVTPKNIYAKINIKV